MAREALAQARKAKGMTQQAVADYLNISLRHYQRIESAFTVGSVETWDALEDLLEEHQRTLREKSSIHCGQEENPSRRLESQQALLA